MKVLFIDCCIRGKDVSRTYRLCDEFIRCYRNHNPSDMITHLNLNQERLSCHTAESLILRDKLIESGCYDDDMFRFARQFAESDKIIVGAPYWDLSFPALLKVYFENICVSGLTFISTEDGLKGICKAQKLIYITTAGGTIGNYDLGALYVRGLCNMLGIESFESLSAESVDMVYSDCDAIMADAIQKIKQIATSW